MKLGFRTERRSGINGSVIGGDALFSNNAEFQYHTSEATSVHLFLDAGNVYLQDRGYNGVRLSTGVGVRYISPIGPIGFDIGHPLDRQAREAAYRLHFSIGSTF